MKKIYYPLVFLIFLACFILPATIYLVLENQILKSKAAPESCAVYNESCNQKSCCSGLIPRKIAGQCFCVFSPVKKGIIPTEGGQYQPTPAKSVPSPILPEGNRCQSKGTICREDIPCCVGLRRVTPIPLGICRCL